MEESAKRRCICDYFGTTTGPSCSHGMVTSSGHDYEVFLSFSGPDTRSGFADFLYTSLIDAGIRTFKDDEELPIGEQFPPKLLQAIKQSKISIPIFSKGYASSVWCLKELVQMVECQKSGGHKIMPIFYDVAPSDVRHQKGVYGEALRSHEEKRRYDKGTISQWKAALNAVGDMNGWDLHNKTDRREGEFARKLTHEVFKELKKAHLAESDYLVNVDNHVDVIMEMIGAGTNETRIIGIHGMGGIGKTTVAKIIYNKLADDFENHCFLRDIRETSKANGNGIQYLQNQLISDILKTYFMEVRDIDEGTQTMKDRSSNKRVLLLLDDVEEKNHIDAFVGKRDWLGRGSKIIITTRKKSILGVPEVDCNYELSSMDSDQSLQLFSKHAFRRDSPLDEYINQSKRAIGIAGGLPLALEVIGSLLSLTKKEEWDLKLNKLENVPDEKVWSKLKISYDVLDVGQQHIFLDIACFFIGYDKNILVHFWNESEYPEDTMEVLQNMSLIKIKENNRVWMHDQIRDLGREMVRQKSKMKIEKKSRLWDTKEALELLKRHEGKTKVEALHLNGQYCFTYEDFKRLSNLRFLKVDHWQGDVTAEESLLWNEGASNGLPINVFQENSNLLPQLRWLSWSQIPLTFNVTNFSMENVVILDLSWSDITHDWKGWSHMKVMKNLKILDLSHCRRLERTPNFSAHSNLERLILWACKSLIELDKSICRLKRLVFLDLGSCGKLRRLPDELGGDLASLEYLYLQDCILLERLPDTIGNLESLIELNISNTMIEELPDSIGKLKKLKVVKMECTEITKFPGAFWMIEKLEEIEASRVIFVFGNEHLHRNIDSCIYKNKSLRVLKWFRMNVDALPRLPESLIELQLFDSRMDTFPDLSNLANLKELHLQLGSCDSGGLVDYPMPQWIGSLSKLESLNLQCHFVTTLPADLSLPPQLTSLRLECPNLRRLPTLPSSLCTFTVKDCDSLWSVGDLSNLKKLSNLEIVSAAITEIQGLDCLENLRDLWLERLEHVKTLPDLSNLSKLRSLQLSSCGNMVEIQGELPRFLYRFQIESCRSLEKLPDLSCLMGKQGVKIDKCNKLNVEAILGYARKNPRDLHIKGFGQLQILPDLRNLRNSNKLTSLQVEDCGNLVEIQGELPESLEKLQIYYCRSLPKLPDLSNLMGLREVRIKMCVSLVEIQGEQLSQSLEELYIECCKSLKKFTDLSRLMGLREVCIHECDNLVEIQGGLPESLEKLKIYSCRSLPKLPDLSSLMGLREVCIKMCVNLVEIQGEQLPQSLEELYIECCKSLKKFTDLSRLMGLREVRIHECDNLVEIQGGLPESLEKLEIYSCRSLPKLPDLSNLMGMREVCISTCVSLVEIQSEQLPQSLEKLTIECCESLKKFPDLSRLMGLREVRIHEFDNLVEIQCGLPESLEKLEIYSCRSLLKLPNLSNLMGLRKVHIRTCVSLVEIQGEQLPQSLEELYIADRESLPKFPDLSRLIGLREVYIGSCDTLVEIQGGLPRSLEKLTIQFCKSLQNLPCLLSLTGLRDAVIRQCGNLVEIFKANYHYHWKD